MTESDPLGRALTDAACREPLGPALTGAAPPDRAALPDVSARAASAGLLDVAYAELDSAVGRLLLAATPRGLVRVAWVDFSGEDAVLAALAEKVSPRVLAAPRRLDEPRRELEEYLAGGRRRFELALDWRLVRGFGRRVLEATAQVPYGSVSTYKQVAREAGNERASRAAGNALGANPLPIVVPCHRILHSTGGLGGYTGGLERKRMLLQIESGQATLGA
ncbi:MAG: methylated-DNA--[protein]-cysteine S-methyltransferase [Solirubrobacterales bacterium]|nr:methylated-DNA--[protein]-cysteine S-methyltransferase [Solirubrobacterales bacterium]